MSTRLVVLADTHLPRRGRQLPLEVLRAAERADATIHLGDFTSESAVEALEQLGPLYAVQGNNDREEIRQRFPLEQRLLIEGYRLALLHGHLGGRTALQAARAVQSADVVFFGHSHQPHVSTEHGVLLLNPGSPTDRRWQPHHTFGVVDIDEQGVRPRLVTLS